MNPKVSVIPTYNYERYIERAVDSVLRQSYESIEVTVADSSKVTGFPS